METRIYEELPYKFTRDELRLLGEDLARANQEVYTLRGNKKTTASSMEAAIKEAEARAAVLTRKLNEKSELRETEVHALMNTPRPGLKTIVRADSDEEIRTEPMTDADRQETLPFAEEPPDGKTTAAGERHAKLRRSN